MKSQDRPGIQSKSLEDPSGDSTNVTDGILELHSLVTKLLSLFVTDTWEMTV